MFDSTFKRFFTVDKIDELEEADVELDIIGEPLLKALHHFNEKNRLLAQTGALVDGDGSFGFHPFIEHADDGSYHFGLGTFLKKAN